MFFKDAFERVISRIESEGNISADKIAKFRERLEGVFFNEYGLCAGEEIDHVFEGSPAIPNRLQSAEVMDFMTPENESRMQEYGRDVIKGNPFSTLESIKRFVETIEKEGYNPSLVKQFYERIQTAQNTTGADCTGDTSLFEGLCSVISAERVLQDMALIGRFREERIKYLTGTERARITLVLRTMESLHRFRASQALDGNLIILN